MSQGLSDEMLQQWGRRSAETEIDRHHDSLGQPQKSIGMIFSALSSRSPSPFAQMINSRNRSL
jgi:hypothetical protein